MHQVILDADTGIDDAVALLYGALSPNCVLRAVTSVWGNVPVATATRNNLALLDLVGRPEVPVATGAAGPLNGKEPVFAPEVHGADGQGNVGLEAVARAADPRHAAALIGDLAREQPGELDLVAVGPLTNVALALALEPSIPKLVRSLTIMGGAADAPGNVTVAAEANIWADPEAAAAVFRASWDITLVPLDVTMRVLMTEDHRRRLLGSGNPVGEHAGRILDAYFEFFLADFGRRTSPMHDVLAVAIAIGELAPRVAPRVSVVVDVSLGPSRGATVCDTRGQYAGFASDTGPVRLVLEADEGFAHRVVDRLAGAP